MSSRPPTYNGSCRCEECVSPVEPVPHVARLEVTDEWAAEQ